MTTAATMTSQDFFEQKYRQNPDPWNFAFDAYEQSRYAAILKALEGRRYQRAFEPGCSIGVLTAGLAAICDHVCAIDISPTAVEKAQERCRKFSNVEISYGALPAEIPAAKFDLIVLSEIGYYFEASALKSIAGMLILRLLPEGVLLAAHWLGDSPDHLLSGDAVHAVLSQLDGLKHDHAERNDGFRLDRWTKKAQTAWENAAQ